MKKAMPKELVPASSPHKMNHEIKVPRWGSPHDCNHSGPYGTCIQCGALKSWNADHLEKKPKFKDGLEGEPAAPKEKAFLSASHLDAASSEGMSKPISLDEMKRVVHAHGVHGPMRHTKPHECDYSGIRNTCKYCSAINEVLTEAEINACYVDMYHRIQRYSHFTVAPFDAIQAKPKSDLPLCGDNGVIRPMGKPMLHTCDLTGSSDLSSTGDSSSEKSESWSADSEPHHEVVNRRSKSTFFSDAHSEKHKVKDFSRHSKRGI